MSSYTALLNQVETALEDRLRKQAGEISFMEQSLAYALLKGGRRIRPVLTLMIAEHLPYPEAAFPSALSTEYIHAASLVADDLPSMDNATIRRNVESTHTVFGESCAILTTYALISDGFKLLGESAALYPIQEERGNRLLEAINLTTKATGIKGLTGGQYLDLHQPPDNLEDLFDLFKRKTSSLFNAAFSNGWIFGGGDLSLLDKVEEAAHTFGLAFQLADDLADEETDRIQGKGFNLCLLMGREKVRTLLDETSHKFEKAIQLLGIPTSRFEELTHAFIG